MPMCLQTVFNTTNGCFADTSNAYAAYKSKLQYIPGLNYPGASGQKKGGGERAANTSGNASSQSKPAPWTQPAAKPR